MTTESPMFDPRKAAGIIKQSLVEKLHRLQTRILLVERFAKRAVTVPMLGALGTDNLTEMLEEHDVLVEQIRRLQAALDAASEADILAFVQGLKRDRK